MESGVPFGWVAGDTVYGSDRQLRRWLASREIPHVLAVKSNKKLWVLTDEGPRQVRADWLASRVGESGWVRLSSGNGTKGPRAGQTHSKTGDRVWPFSLGNRRYFPLDFAQTAQSGADSRNESLPVSRLKLECVCPGAPGL